jgi:hemerythrin-like domain-containing protein
MNAIELLKQDHKEAMGMIEQMENPSQGTPSGRANMDMFNQLKQALTLHTQEEEQVFYPALREHNETRQMIEEAYEEHKNVDRMLAQMSGMDPNNSDFMDMLGELKENIQHHVEEEETEMFPKAEKILGQSRLQEMGRQMRQMKQGMSATATQRQK